MGHRWQRSYSRCIVYAHQISNYRRQSELNSHLTQDVLHITKWSIICILVSSNKTVPKYISVTMSLRCRYDRISLQNIQPKHAYNLFVIYWYKTKYCCHVFFPWETNRGLYCYLTKSFKTQRLEVHLGSNVYTLSSACMVASDRKLTGIIDSCFMIVVIVRMSITMINLSRVTPFVLF